MADATLFYAPGPSQVWLGIGASKAWRFLGWTESGLTIRLIPTYEDVQADYAGASPGATQLLGQEAAISGVFARYDETVAMQAASFGGLNGQQGTFQQGIIGSLMHQEGLDYPILVYSPYSFKTIFSSSMVPGFWFYSGWLAEPHEANYSIRVKKPSLGFRAVPVFGTYSGSTFEADMAPFDSSILYTNVMPSPLPSTN